MRKNTPRVVILTSTITQPTAEMLQGVLQYQQEHGPWRIYQQENRRWISKMNDWRAWGCTGIIAADHHSHEEAEIIASSGVPVVVLLQPHPMRQDGYPLRPYSCCLWDSQAIGRMAAEYFLNRLYTTFAYVGDVNPESYWSIDRKEAFHRTIRQAGHGKSYHVYPPCPPGMRDDWMAEKDHMIEWLKSLPKPIALFAPNDRRGKQVIDACLDAGISVPSKISILGCDDTSWICEATVPTLSSVHCFTRKAGYEIAAHLDALMRGEKFKRREFLISPTRVTTRQSTDWMNVPDKIIKNVLQKINENACNIKFTTDTLAKHFGISRRMLEIRFKNATGRTIHAEIDRIRLERLHGELLESRKPISEITYECGFKDQTHLGRIFKAIHGTTMCTFRKKNGL